MRTDYEGHDSAYRKLKADGKIGWSSTGDIDILSANVERLVQAGHVPKSGRLLELGCGAGDLSLRLHGRGYELHGIDISITAVEWAQEKATQGGIQAEFKVGNVLDLKGYPDSYFDAVLDGHCFHCIIGEDRKRFLASARRVLRSDGVLMIATMCNEPGVGWAKEHFDSASRNMIADNGVAVRHLGRAEDILQEVSDAGLAVRHWEVIPAPDKADQDELLISCMKKE